MSAGACFRLYTAWAYKNELEENTIPEVSTITLFFMLVLSNQLVIKHDMVINHMFVMSIAHDVCHVDLLLVLRVVYTLTLIR